MQERVLNLSRYQVRICLDVAYLGISRSYAQKVIHKQHNWNIIILILCVVSKFTFYLYHRFSSLITTNGLKLQRSLRNPF